MRVAEVLGLEAPEPEPTFYHNNVTAGISIFNETLPTIKALRVGVLASTKAEGSLQQAAQIKERLEADGVFVSVVGETLIEGAVDQTYSFADATAYDGVIVADGAEGLFDSAKPSPLFPTGRPGQILLDAYRWGKPVGALGKADQALKSTGVPAGTPGVFTETAVDKFVESFEGGLAKNRYTDRFALDDSE